MSETRTEKEIVAEAYSDEAAKTWRAPVQRYPDTIPWPIHLEAYAAYVKRWSKQTALIDLKGRGCRGGFGIEELDLLVPGWRDRVSYIGRLEARIADLITERDNLSSIIANGIDDVAGAALDDAEENSVPAELLKRTFVIQHNPNCPSPFLVRLGGAGPIDMKPYGDGIGLRKHQTGDILGFGKTLAEAANAALSYLPPSQGTLGTTSLAKEGK